MRKARLLADELVGLRAELAGSRAQRAGAAHRAPRAAGPARQHSARASSSSKPQQRSEAVDEARARRVRTRAGAGAAARPLHARRAATGAARRERRTTSGIECTTVSQAMIDEARAEIDEIADGLGDAQDAAAEASREVIARPRRTRRPRRRHRRAERARLGARHAHHGAARVCRSRGIRPRRRARRRGASAARARCRPRPPRRGGGGASRASIPTSCPRGRPPSTPRRTSAPSARRPTPRRPSAGCASGCMPPSASVESLTAQTTALGRALDVTQRRRRARRARRRRASEASSATPCKVTPGYEAAIAAALGPLAEGVLVETRDDAFAVGPHRPRRRSRRGRHRDRGRRVHCSPGVPRARGHRPGA